MHGFGGRLFTIFSFYAYSCKLVLNSFDVVGNSKQTVFDIEIKRRNKVK
jgi:hypothetical protein